MSINSPIYHGVNKEIPGEATQTSANTPAIPSASANPLLSKRITWIHGTNSLVLEQMRYTGYTLKPTGKLIEDRIIPFNGELFGGGMDFYGVSRKKISGMDGFNSNAYQTTWLYATEKSHGEFTKFESSLMSSIDKILANIQSKGLLLNDAIRLTILVLQLRQWNEPLYQSSHYAEKIGLVKELVPTLGKVALDGINKLRKLVDCQVPKEPDLTGEKLSQIIEENSGLPADWFEKDLDSDGSAVYKPSSMGYQIENQLEGYILFWNKKTILSCILNRGLDRSLYSAIVALKNHKPDLFDSKIEEVEQAFIEVEQEVNLARKNLLKALSDEPLPIRLGEEERRKWQNTVAFPLLLASSQDLHPNRELRVFGEAAIEQSLQIGKEIDILATDEAHIEELRTFVQGHLPDSVRVYTNEEIKHLLASS